MIKEEKCYSVECDGCHEIVESAEGYILFVTEDQAHDVAVNENMWTKEGDRYYCPGCSFVQEEPEMCSSVL